MRELELALMHIEIRLVAHRVSLRLRAVDPLGQRAFAHRKIPAENDVVVVLLRLFIEYLAHIERKEIVAVRKEHILCRRLRHPVISRLAHALIFRAVHIKKVGISLGIFPQNVG